MKKLLASFMVLLVIVLCSGYTYAQYTATWALTTAAAKTVVVTGAQAANVVAQQMLPGATFASGTHNSDGFQCASSAAWPTVATDGMHLDFPLSPDGESNLSITGLTIGSKVSGSSGSQMISLAYQVDGAGSWIALGTPQEAPSGGSSTQTFGTLNAAFDNGHTYIVRMYIYAKASGTSASRKYYLKNVAFTGAITSANTPTITVSASSLPAFGNVVMGSTSSEKSYTVEAKRLTADLTVTAQSPFQISLDNVTYGSNLTLPQSGGIVTSTTIYSRFAPVTAAGPLTGTISNESPGALIKKVTVTGNAIAVEPITPSVVSFGEITGNSIEVKVSGGSGVSRIIVAHADSPVTWVPADGVAVTGENSDFSAATDQGNGNKVVMNFPDSAYRSVVVTGLSAFSTYYFAVYEYNGNVGSANYLTATPGLGSAITLKVPGLTVSTSKVSFGNVLVNSTSVEKTYTLSGKFLTPESGSVKVTAPANFEISATSGAGFTNSLDLSYSEGTLAASNIYVRFLPVTLTDYSGVITNVGGGAPDLNIAVTGSGKDSSSFITKAIYVSPDGNDATGNGSIGNPYKTLYKAGLKLTNDYTLVLRGGTYPQDSIILRDVNLTNISIINAPGEHPIIDGTTGYDVVVLYCNYSHISGLEIIKAGHNALAIMGHYNLVENCSFHHGGDAGMKLGSHYQTNCPRGNTIRNCDAYANYDKGKNGGNADGYAAKWNVGSGNRFVSCRAWENSDDGFDLWQADSTIIMDSCWCFRNGYDVFKVGAAGNGNGFKIGGAPVCVPHIMRNCISFDNTGSSGGKGFDQNSNFAGHIMLNCLSWGNSYLDFNFYKPSTNGTLVAKNNIQYKGTTSPYIKFVDGDISNNSWAALKFQTGNTWKGFTVTDNDFQSVDTTLAKLPRKADGTLQVTSLYRLKPGSQLLDKGVDVGIGFYGSAPDLGPYESGLEPAAIKSEPIVGPRSFNLYQNYPNPFNPTTMIQFSIAKPSKVQLKIYNSIGREIMTLVDNQLNTGVHTVNFNAANLPTGVYFYRLITNEYSSTKKMLLIK